MLVRVLVLLLVSLTPMFADAATLYLDPSTGTYGPGDTFIVNVRLTNDGDCINAVHAALSYPKDVLRAVDFGKGDSILSLWVEEPKINDAAGTITFSGGIPGGYCGRVHGDPGLSNNLGKIVFTVLSASSSQAALAFSPSSALYLNDGSGTLVKPTLTGATIVLSPTPTGKDNPWLSEVKADTIPPEPFEVQAASTPGVFGGRYYLVFATTDKQSGIDHYELRVANAWQSVTSPHVIQDESMLDAIQLRAVDKAGNVRLGSYTPNSLPPRHYSLQDFTSLFVVIAILILALLARYVMHKRAPLPVS